MNHKKNRFLFFVVLLVLGSNMVWAQSEVRSSRYEKIIEARKTFVSQDLDLTEDQSKQFWPLYESYLSELHTIKRENRKGKKKRSDLVEEDAKEALQKLMRHKRDEMELQLSFYEDLTSILSAKQILHLDYQERKFHEKVVEKLRKGRKKGGG